MIYLLSIPLENEPWIHSKIHSSSIYVLRCQANGCTAGRVQSAAGKPWVICMPQIFVHWIWLAEETGIAADIKHALVPLGSHCHKLTALHQFKNQHQYLSFFIFFRKNKLIQIILGIEVISMHRTLTYYKKMKPFLDSLLALKWPYVFQHMTFILYLLICREQVLSHLHTVYLFFFLAQIGLYFLSYINNF